MAEVICAPIYAQICICAYVIHTPADPIHDHNDCNDQNDSSSTVMSYRIFLGRTDDSEEAFNFYTETWDVDWVFNNVEST